MKPHVKGRWYFVLGILGFILTTCYAVSINLDIKSTPISKIILWLCILLIHFASSIVCIYTGFAFRSGYIDRAIGTKASAILFKNGAAVFSGRLRAVKVLFNDNAKEIDLVFFMTGFRPWICPKEKFLTEKD